MPKTRPKPGKVELVAAWLILINGGICLLTMGIAVVVWHKTFAWMDSSLITSVIGVFSALLAMRGNLVGLLGGMLFYGMQVVCYYSRDVQLGFRSGINYFITFHPPQATLIVNLIAVGGLALTLLILGRRWRLVGFPTHPK